MSEPRSPLSSRIDACFEGTTGLLSADEALRRIEQATAALSGRETVSIKAALGRVLANDYVSPMDVPGHTNSAVDGYAFNAKSLPENGEMVLEVVASVLAGHRLERAVGVQQCARVMTGATMPQGTDTVVMQEHVVVDGSRIRVQAGHRQGQNVRHAGEDLKRGQVVLKRGRRLTPADLGLLASVGNGEVAVTQRPRVSYFSTGDELRSIGESLAPGEVYDSNRYTLHGMLSRAGVSANDLGVVPDEPQAIRSTLISAAESSDLVLTSGGVSSGDADHVKRILFDLGDVRFWRIAVRPGRPLAFGRVGNALFFGLPGNPVAVMVTFYQFVLPALARIEGEVNPSPIPLLEACCREPLRKKTGRVEYYRAVLYRSREGRLEVRPTGKTGSGLLHTMSDANCFIVLDASTASLPADSIVPVQPFHGLI